MIFPTFPVIRFAAFLFVIGLMGGSFFSLYRDEKMQNLPPKAFSTQEIAKTRKISRKLHRAELKNNDLESDIALLNHQIGAFEESNAALSPPREPQAHQEAVALLLGNEPVQGEGVEITLQDSKMPLHLGDNPNLGIVHNVDLLLLTNQLWAAGARAVAINQQRIVGKTNITCAGPIIMANKTRISSPFTIQVLGPSQKILQRLNHKNSYLKYLASYGIPYSLEVKEMRLPAYAMEETYLDLDRN